jgi:hypothetical protein
MALKILYRGHNNTYMDLEPNGFNQDNTPVQPAANALITADTPRGVLGGSVAGVYGARLNGKADSTHLPLGLYVNNAEGAPFDNSYTVASGKGVFIHGDAMVAVDVYETEDEAAAPLTYNAGDALYTSGNGFLTKADGAAGGVNANGNTDVLMGIVVDVPTTDNPFLTLLLRV